MSFKITLHYICYIIQLYKFLVRHLKLIFFIIYLGKKFAQRVDPVIGRHEWEVEDVVAEGWELVIQEEIDEENLTNDVSLEKNHEKPFVTLLL